MSHQLQQRYRPHRFFVNITLPWASPYAMGPTQKGYPTTAEGRETALRDAADTWGVDPEDLEVWPANPSEYGYGHE